MTPAVTRTAYDRLVKFLKDEDAEEQDLATDAQEHTLGDIREALGQLDILSGSMSVVPLSCQSTCLSYQMTCQ